MKNMKKWLSLLLTCVLLIGTFVIVPISANEVTSDATVEIVANNIYHGDAYYMMYAVDAQNLADGETVQMIICDANGEEIYGTATQDGTVVYNDTTCLKFVSDKGIPAQNIATTVYAQAQVVNANDEVVAKSAIQAYSVMEFIYETQLKGVADADDITLFNALIDYATVAQSIMEPNASVKIGDVSYSYVEVVNGTIDGTNTELMVNTSAGAVEGLLANLTTTLEVGDKTLAWDVTVAPMGGAGSTTEMTDADAKAVTVEAGKKITLTAKVIEGAVAVTNTFDVSGFGTTTSYSTYTSEGWTVANAQMNNYTPAGIYVPVLNGKTSAVGTLTSATLTDGIQKLSFNYGLPFSESNGVSFTIEIKQGDTVVASTTLIDSSSTKNDSRTFEWVLDTAIEGDFVIVFTNNSPSNSTSNKDRTAIWNITWVNA